MVFDTGAYADAGPVVTRSSGMAITGPYKIPHVWSDSFCVYLPAEQLTVKGRMGSAIMDMPFQQPFLFLPDLL